MKITGIKKAAVIILASAIVLWVAVIWINSMQTGESSGKLSSSVTDAINAFLSSISPSWAVSHLFVRKAAHFCEFAGLALLVCALIFVWFIGRIEPDEKLSRIFSVAFALPAVIAVAAIDETIQLFVDGRAGSVIDVLIDTSGAATATLSALAVLLAVRAVRAKKAEKRKEVAGEK